MIFEDPDDPQKYNPENAEFLTSSKFTYLNFLTYMYSTFCIVYWVVCTSFTCLLYIFEQ